MLRGLKQQIRARANNLTVDLPTDALMLRGLKLAYRVGEAVKKWVRAADSCPDAEGIETSITVVRGDGVTLACRQ